MKRINNNYQNLNTINFYSIFIAVLLSLSCVLTAKADTSIQARSLINQMSKATDELHYDGIFVFSRGQQIDTMRIIHRADENGSVERLFSMSGIAREVIRDEEGVKCIFPDNQKVMVDKVRPREFIFSQLPEPIEQVAQFYYFSVAGLDRVAGKEAWVVNVVPKDNYRYGYQLWIDKDSKLLLKSALKDQKGRSIEQIIFTQLDIVDHIDEKLLQPELVGANYTWHENNYDRVNAKTQKSNWSVNWMPKGFNQTEHEQQQPQDSSFSVDHIIYSDGLAVVSVFIEKLDETSDFAPGLTQMGGINAFTVSSSGYQVTAVGEVPKKTVQQMAISVKRLSN